MILGLTCINNGIKLLITMLFNWIPSQVKSCLDSSLLIHAFLHVLLICTLIYILRGSNFSDLCRISPATVKHCLLYILHLNNTRLVMSNNLFTFILTIVLLFCCCKIPNVCISLVRVAIFNYDGDTGRRLFSQVTSMQCNTLTMVH